MNIKMLIFILIIQIFKYKRILNGQVTYDHIKNQFGVNFDDIRKTTQFIQKIFENRKYSNTNNNIDIINTYNTLNELLTNKKNDNSINFYFDLTKELEYIEKIISTNPKENIRYLNLDNFSYVFKFDYFDYNGFNSEYKNNKFLEVLFKKLNFICIYNWRQFNDVNKKKI